MMVRLVCHRDTNTTPLVVSSVNYYLELHNAYNFSQRM